MNLCHVYPINDLKPHVSELYCECMPYGDHDEPTVIIHPSYDGRELREYFKRA